MEEFNLNDPRNLNPDIRSLKDVESRIEEWNNKPEVKENNIEAIDKNKYEKISKPSLNIMKIMAFFGVIALLIIAGYFAIAGWTLYNDGTFINPVNLVCGNVTLNCEPQSCVNECKKDCPACVCECDFPNEINVNIKNGTG